MGSDEEQERRAVFQLAEDVMRFLPVRHYPQSAGVPVPEMNLSAIINQRVVHLLTSNRVANTRR
jgi:hypothetical protein